MALGLSLLALVPCATPAAAIYFDATGIGEPIVTSDSAIYYGTAINSQGDGVWGFTVVIAGDPAGAFVPRGLELLHPVTHAVSDSFDIDLRLATAANVTLFIGGLYTSDPSGVLTGHVSTCPAMCRAATNNGGFQLAYSGLATSAGTVDVYLKSDIYPVPVPAAISGFAAALFTLRALRRRAVTVHTGGTGSRQRT